MLVESHDHRIFELDPAKVERKKDEILWSLSDRPAEALATSDWVVDDLGAAFAIQVKLEKENASFDLQLPHPPDVGDLPTHPPTQSKHGAAISFKFSGGSGSETRHKSAVDQCSSKGPVAKGQWNPPNVGLLS